MRVCARASVGDGCLSTIAVYVLHVREPTPAEVRTKASQPKSMPNVCNCCTRIDWTIVNMLRLAGAILFRSAAVVLKALGMCQLRVSCPKTSRKKRRQITRNQRKKKV